MTLIDFWPLLVPAAFLLVLIGLLLHQRKVNRLRREALKILIREMTGPTETTMNDTCGTCRFWVVSANIEKGTCRRYPPAIVVDEWREDPVDEGMLGSWHARIDEKWPVTLYNQWCGEWQQAEVKP